MTGSFRDVNSTNHDETQGETDGNDPMHTRGLSLIVDDDENWKLDGAV